MKKKLITVSLILVFAIGGVFATRLGVSYNNTEYILNTSRAISSDNKGYSTGMYDAFVSVQQGKQLNEIYDIIKAKNFTDVTDPDALIAMKAEYLDGFIDCMNNYSYGTEGAFKDIYPIYEKLMSSPVSYKNSGDIVYFGAARFYPTNI